MLNVLGTWDLSATMAVDEAIKKARRAFFAFGAMGAFHGRLNPISSKTIYDVCIVPILLYGSENWILTVSLLDRLEAFQGEIGRRILKLSKFRSLHSSGLEVAIYGCKSSHPEANPALQDLFRRRLYWLPRLLQTGRKIFALS